jgi:nucleotide-binding universal stress UspA family protein
MGLFHTILHATDFEDKSAGAFQLACELARQNEADLVVLHVAPKGVVKYLDKVSERDAAQSHEELWSALRKHPSEEDNLNVSHRLEEGTPTAVIQRVSREVDADLLVIGPSTSPNVPLLWLTSGTLDELVHQATCPVLVVRPKVKPTEAFPGDQTGDDVAPPAVGMPFIP